MKGMIKMKVTYTRKGDYLLPDLHLEKDENYGNKIYKTRRLFYTKFIFR